MKFNLFLKTIVYLVLIFSVEVLSTQGRISAKLKRNSHQRRQGIKTSVPNPFRFQNYEQMNSIKENNMLLLNSEVLASKPLSDKEEFEIDVNAQRAISGSEFKWSFLWWNLMHFPASNALKSDKTYWLSKRGIQHDHWEAQFDVPQKIDVIDIHWRLPPKRFRVFFKLDEKSDYIPVTEVFEKSSFVNKEGQISAQDAISEHNAIVFHKPIFARRIRINMNEPVKKSSFSIYSVTFYQKRTTMLIKNELIDDTQHYCLYANSNMPRQGVKVEAYPCLKALTLANNNELWIYYNDSSVRHYNSKLCLGFNVQNEMVLMNCGEYNPAYTIQFRNDNTLFFTGYQDKCIVVDDSKKVSSNFIDEHTEVLVTSQADSQNFKKENFLMPGENYWHSTPGQKKATIQILFGKIKTGPFKGKFENKKIDIIKIDWVKQPKKFLVYTWKPGYSWNLRYTYTNFTSKLSEIKVVGEEAAAIMLVLEEPHLHEDLGGMPAYAIQNISITIQSMTMKQDICGNYLKKLKIFDFDTQSYHKLENSHDYYENRKKLSISFEKLVSGFTNLKMTLKGIQKAKSKASSLVEKSSKLKRVISDETVKKLKNFKAEILTQVKNANFQNFLSALGPKGFMDSVTGKKTLISKLGSKSLPARDCLSIKKLVKNALSGWYYIKTECSPKPIRVFCDYTVIADATDIYVFSDNSKDTNPDLTYLGVKDFTSIRYQCAKVGLFPLEIKNADTLLRIYQILIAMGYDLAKPIAIPLGYDYTCEAGKCAGIVNSLNDRQSPIISSFFAEAGKNSKGGLVKSGPFVGLGYSSNHSMIKFDALAVKISGIICSTNHFKTDSTDTQVKAISCELSPHTNGDIFSEGSNILVECPSGCQNSKAIIYGTNIYHVKSSICKSAIHSSIIPSEGGRLFVRVTKPLPKYLGSVANGIQSVDNSDKDLMNSFTVIKYEPVCPINQFQDYVKAEKESQKNDDNEKPSSSFMETSLTVSMAQAREKFEQDLSSHELEGVDLEDIRKAGIKANNPENIDLNKPDNDQENFEYNKNHGDQNIDNNNSDDNNSDDFQPINDVVNKAASVNTEMMSEANDNADYNNDQGTSEIVGNDNNSTIDSDQNGDTSFKFSEKENSENEENPAVNASATQQTDKMASGDSQQKVINNKMKDIKANNTNSGLNKDDGLKNEVNPKNNQNNPANPNNPPVQSAPKAPVIPASPSNAQTPARKSEESPTAPKPGQTEPSLPDSPKIKKPSEKEPNTDDGNTTVKKIRQVVDEGYLNTLKSKSMKIKKAADDYMKSLGWSKEGSKLSVLYIQKNVMMIEKYRSKVIHIMKKLADESLSRVLKTKKLKQIWREQLDKLESTDMFKIDYSLPAEVLIKKVFNNSESKSPIKSNWNVFTENLKDRARAIGNTSKVYSKTQLVGSILHIKGREYFDFNMNVDILVKSNGVAGIAFRMKDQFNFYGFYIDKLKGLKALVKVENGVVKVLKKVIDGGILVNNWHRVNIKTTAGKLRVFIYDSEQPNKSTSEKILEAFDYTFSSGTIGFFVNEMEGFFFDNMDVTASPCWTPWVPMKNLKFDSPMSSVYSEDFSGTISEKFISVEPDDNEDGPSEWKMHQFHEIGKSFGLKQKTLIYDKSQSRKPTMLIYQDKIMSSGDLTVGFVPKNTDGVVSVIFKYSKETSTSEMFYSFDLVSDKVTPQFVLRKHQNGVWTQVHTVNKLVKGLKTIGYKAEVVNKVLIQLLRERITIKVAQDNSEFVTVIDVYENSIPSGSFGIGTYKVKASFIMMDIFPPDLQFTESERLEVMSADSEDLAFPQFPNYKNPSSNSGDFPAFNSKVNPNNPSEVASANPSLFGQGPGVKSAAGGSETADKAGLSAIPSDNMSSFKQINNQVGWKTCVSTATVENRNNYCKRFFPIEESREKCKDDFCNTCCEQNVNESQRNVIHLCVKSCKRATIAETSPDDYKSVCIRTEDPLHNIYDYCEGKMNPSRLPKKICKMDMCYLCCSTMDSIKHKNYSVNMINNCFEDCNKEFNPILDHLDKDNI